MFSTIFIGANEAGRPREFLVLAQFDGFFVKSLNIFLAYFENGELVPGEFFDQFDDKKPKERKKEKKSPESPMAVVWPSGEVFTNCSTSSSKKSKKTKQAEKTATCPDCEKEKKAESQDDLDEFPDFQQ